MLSSSGAIGFLYNVPWSLRKFLSWIKEKYGDPEIIITENGFSIEGEDKLDKDMALNDIKRVQYIRDHVNEVLKAVKLDGVKVQGYFVWSLLDNFEWGEGYRVRFGIHHVDFDDPSRPRTPKLSAEVFKDIVKNNGFPPEKENTKTEL